ncbi:phospholipid-transporting ATPase VA isoform X1 [Tachysurus ichikawai]
MAHNQEPGAAVQTRNRRRGKKDSKTRTVHANVVYEQHKDNRLYANNKIKTTKYTVLSFIPKNLFEQFHRFANVYFVFIALLNFVPLVNAFQPVLALAPVLFILSVTAIKDLWEDYRRHRSDQEINHMDCLVYSRHEFFDTCRNRPSDCVREVKVMLFSVMITESLHLCPSLPPSFPYLTDSAGVCFS